MSRYPSQLHKISREGQEKHFRSELGLHELPHKASKPQNIMALRYKLAFGTPEEKEQAKAKLIELGDIKE